MTKFISTNHQQRRCRRNHSSFSNSYKNNNINNDFHSNENKYSSKRLTIMVSIWTIQYVWMTQYYFLTAVEASFHSVQHRVHRRRSDNHRNNNNFGIGVIPQLSQLHRRNNVPGISNLLVFATKDRKIPTPNDASITTATTMKEKDYEKITKMNKKKESKFYLPRKIVRLYTDYAKRLWLETNTDARKNVDSHRVAKSILLVQQLLLLQQSDSGLSSSSSSSSRSQQQIITAATSSYYSSGITNGNTNHRNYTGSSNIPEPQRQQLLDACAAALQSIGIVSAISNTASNSENFDATEPLNGFNKEHTTNGDATYPVIDLEKALNDPNPKSLPSPLQISEAEVVKTTTKPPKSRRSIGFGAAMGLVVTCWVFSGNYLFTGLFTLMTALGQLEYYRMVMNTGVFPARRISVIGACSMFLAALFTPDLHQIVLPISGLWAMVWFLTMRRTLTPIPEIATTFTGLFYLGYVPSFWVRIRLIGMGREPTRLAPIVGPVLKFLEAQGKTLPFIPQAIHLPITTGAIFIFWTWLSLAFSDVGAYFVGRSFGKTKLGAVFPAAGATSPNKTIEGVVGGCAVSALLAIAGAWVQRWPYPILTGAIHGLFLGLLGLLGDLTASMLKRDAGLKDFGDLLPEHGGIMDRVDSFIWTAPYSWIVCAYVIPALKQMFR